MDYHALEKFLITLSNESFTQKVIGKSVLGKKIYAVEYVSNTKNPWVLISSAIHAREHLSCNLVTKLIEDLSKEKPKFQFNIAFVPLVNPDGADIAVNGTQNLSNSQRQKLEKINGSNDFSLFKANANGVDLNNNFDANWQTQFSKKKAPAASGYYGKKPFSEPESRALMQYAQKLNLFFSISYHLKGEEIYFDFWQDDKIRKRDLRIAKVFAKSTGYKIVLTQNCSSGGFKDWCVQKLKIPAITIELGNDKFSHPFPQSEFGDIYSKNKNAILCINKAYNIWRKYNGRKIYEKSANTSKKGLSSR